MAKYGNIISKVPAATVEKVTRTATGGERIVVRNSDGSREVTTTSASSVAAIQRAATTYRRALKDLADE
jgi:hypothetical protein